MPPAISARNYLILVAIGGLLLIFISGTVHTSEVKTHESNDADKIRTDNSLDLKLDQSSSDQIPTEGAAVKSDARQRSGRMYQSTGGQGTPLESYAAAYAAANSGADHSSNNHITQQATNDATAFSSFGDNVPPTSSERNSLLPSTTVRQLPNPGDYGPSSSYFASYMSPSSNEASYSGQSTGSTYAHGPSHSQHHYYKSPAAGLPMGYPTNAYERAYPMSNYYDRVAHQLPAASTPFWATTTSGFGSGGLMSSATNAISHWTNGFSIGEIICGLVALAIGAIILGAPFFLIYLALMGNFSGSGTLSLTNPTSSAATASGAAAPANGRRKRLAVFETMNLTSEQAKRHPDFATLAESVVKQISPHINLQQVSMTFKQLLSSIEKFSPAVDYSAKKRSSRS